MCIQSSILASSALNGMLYLSKTSCELILEIWPPHHNGTGMQPNPLAHLLGLETSSVW